MKLTEALSIRQPLFESQFKDFRAKIRKEIVNISDEDTGMLYETYVEMMNALGEDHSTVNQSDFEDPEFFMQTIRFVIDHPYAKRDLNDIQNSPLVFPDETPMEAYSSGLARAMGEIEVKASRPENQEPDYEEIGGSAIYTVYHIKNYAAARAFCNKYNTSHCIGSSNPNWFPKYEDKYIGNTYALTAGNKLIYVHSGNNGFLITSSDNSSEIDDRFKERGEGIGKVMKELASVGLTIDEMAVALRDAMPNLDDYESDFDGIVGLIYESKSEYTEILELRYTKIFTAYIDGQPSIVFSDKLTNKKLTLREISETSAVIVDKGQTRIISSKDFFMILKVSFEIEREDQERVFDQAAQSAGVDHMNILLDIINAL